MISPGSAARQREIGPCLRVVRLEAQRLLEGRDRVCGATGAQQGGAMMVADLGIIGPEPHRLSQVANRGVDPTELEARTAGVVPGVGLGRIKLQGAFVGRDRLGRPIQLEMDIAHLDVRLGEVRF